MEFYRKFVLKIDGITNSRYQKKQTLRIELSIFFIEREGESY
jgi:hypothetical protein